MSFADQFGTKKAMPARTNLDDAPAPVRKLLLDLIEDRVEWDDEFRPYDMVCDALDMVPVEDEYTDVRRLTREAVQSGLDWTSVYDLIEQLAGGDQDGRVEAVMAKAGMGYTFYGGGFHLYEPVADELEVTGIEDLPMEGSLRPAGKYAAPLAQYQKAVGFLRSRPSDLANAVASAVNALEGTVRVASGSKNISDGVKKLFTGQEVTLGKSMEMLFNFGSAKDSVRHGGVTGADLTDHEAAHVVRCAGSAIAFIVAADRDGTL